MSNTIKGSKGAGYEYWSRRPFSQSTPGRFSKHRTHKAERKQAVPMIQAGLDEVEQDEQEKQKKLLEEYYESICWD